MLHDGLTYTSTLTVSQNDTAMKVGSGDLPVLATPKLVALMENAAMMAVAKDLPDDETTVGGHIHINHLSPSPVGAEVVATATLTKVDGRRLHFDILAYQDGKCIGEATHVRFVVNREKFMHHALNTPAQIRRKQIQ